MLNDLVSKLNGGEILGLFGIMLGLFAVTGGLVVAITTVIAAHYRKTQLDEIEATLKIEMIQRGMSADDIQRVLESKMSGNKGRSLVDLLGSIPPPWRMPNMGGKEAKKT